MEDSFRHRHYWSPSVVTSERKEEEEEAIEMESTATTVISVAVHA